ncbi:uncharacterized protein LOC111269655 isoform X2 [Varroa jacobsoni]|uniref:uncharacterized protein LOC111269655 isoform X2 n=1 Tax=Varroa jacobsoni TaxID=62625 RepID=UPI000BF5561D|nr:uncharacterized protein LOC111269655 isoform X2 [Varroa jacobsoni]
MFRKPVTSIRPPDTQSSGEIEGGEENGSTKITRPQPAVVSTINTAVSRVNGTAIYSNTIDNDERIEDIYASIPVTNITTDTGRSRLQTCVISAGGTKSGPLPEAPLELLAEIQRELPVYFRNHDSEKHYGVFARQNSEQFRDTDSIRFMKQHRLSWWCSPVNSSDNSVMADESPDQFRETSQDIYEVVAENHRDNNYETARKCQTEQTDESLSKNIDDAKKNPHDYEVIPEDFFLKQRELRDFRSAAVPAARSSAPKTFAPVASVSSTNPFHVGASNMTSDYSSPLSADFPILPDTDSFSHHPSRSSELTQASLYDVPRSPQPPPGEKGSCLSDNLYTPFDISLGNRGNESGEDGSSLTYDLPRKTERGKARHDSNQETGEISCELNKHYDVPANLPHPAARPRRVIPEPRRNLLRENNALSCSDANKNIDTCHKLSRMTHPPQNNQYEVVSEKPVPETSSGLSSEAVRVPAIHPRLCSTDDSAKQGSAAALAEMLIFPDTYDLPIPAESAQGEQDPNWASDLSSLLLNEPTYDVPLATSTTPPPAGSPPPPSDPPPPPPLSSSPLSLPPPSSPPPALISSTSVTPPLLSLSSMSYPLQTQQQPPVATSASSSGVATGPITDSGHSSSSSTSGVSLTIATPLSPVFSSVTEHHFREQIVATNHQPPPVPAPRQKAPPPLPPKTEVTAPRSRPFNEHRKFSLQNTSASPVKESVLSERGNSLTSWYLDTNQIRNCDIPHRELMGSSEDGSTDPSSMPSMSLAFPSPLKHSPSGKLPSSGLTGSGLHQRSGSRIFSSAIKISSKLMRKQSATATISSESWDSNSADSDTNDGMVLYFNQLDGRKDYCQRLCVIGDGFLKLYDNDLMTSPSLCLSFDEVTLLLARRDICPSSKSAPNLFLIDVRANGVSRSLGFTSAIERAEFLRRVNQSFNPPCLQLQGEIWASGILWCRYSASGDWQNVKAVIHGKEFTPILAERQDNDAATLDGTTRTMTVPANVTIDLRKAKAVEWTPASQGMGGGDVSSSSPTVPSSSGGSPPMDRIFHIVLPGQTIYLRGPASHETLAWFDLLEKTHTTYLDKKLLSEQYLNTENVPLAVEKCVNFVSAHGSDLIGVYRLPGSQVKIERLVEALKRNAWDVHLVPEDYSAHDVANVLRRFLRSFDDCLLTQRLYDSWIKCSKIESLDERLPRLKDIISELPTVECATLRYLCSHLKAIADRHEVNLMTEINLATIFGPTILFKESPTSRGYRDPTQTPTTSLAETNYSLTIAADLLNHFCFLFDVSQEVVAKEREIQRLMAELREARVAQRPAGDILVGVHIYNREWGRCLNIKLTPSMTALGLCRSVRAQLKLADLANTLAVFEVICDQQLERPLHHSESVFRAVLRWTDWDTEFAKGNYLLVKRNYIYDDVINFRNNVKQPLANASEVPFAEASSKKFNKVSMEFARAALQIVKERKDSKDKSLKEKRILKEWLAENIEVYVGAEPNRKAPTKFCLSFLIKNEQVRRDMSMSPMDDRINITSPNSAGCVQCDVDQPAKASDHSADPSGHVTTENHRSSLKGSMIDVVNIPLAVARSDKYVFLKNPSTIVNRSGLGDLSSHAASRSEINVTTAAVIDSVCGGASTNNLVESPSFHLVTDKHLTKSNSGSIVGCLSNDPARQRTIACNQVCKSDINRENDPGIGACDYIGNQERPSFYADGAKYWEGIEPTIEGMLGGFAEISDIDVGASKRFLREFCERKQNATGTVRALDCGAGIGRVTKMMLSHIFTEVDMLEQNQQFLDKADDYLGDIRHKVGRKICAGLQSFIPDPERRYDVIWVQWVTGHLTDTDFVEFLKKAANGLRENGLVCIKDNLSSCSVEMDNKDSSVTRPRSLLLEIFKKLPERTV